MILGTQYDNYDTALEQTGLEKLSERREHKCLEFGLKSLLHPLHCKKFPVNPEVYTNSHNTRHKEHFVVSESYRQSAILCIQRKLNEYVTEQHKKK